MLGVIWLYLILYHQYRLQQARSSQEKTMEFPHPTKYFCLYLNKLPICIRCWCWQTHEVCFLCRTESWSLMSRLRFVPDQHIEPMLKIAPCRTKRACTEGCNDVYNYFVYNNHLLSNGSFTVYDRLVCLCRIEVQNSKSAFCSCVLQISLSLGPAWCSQLQIYLPDLVPEWRSSLPLVGWSGGISFDLEHCVSVLTCIQ